jgi:hypothetical protein
VKQYGSVSQRMLTLGVGRPKDASPHAGFYAYLALQPSDCASAPIQPEQAGWVETMGEWMMPYEAVRACPDPRGAVLEFLRSVYRVALTEGGWDGPAFEYTRPSPAAGPFALS